MIRTGNIVVYRAGAALVEGCSGEKFSIRTANGDTKNVREKDIVFCLHPGPASQIPVPAEPPADWTSALELIEGEELTFSDFTEFIFGKYAPDTAYGAWLLIQDGTYFAFDGKTVRMRPEEEIEKSLAAIREKAEAKQKHEELVKRIKSGAVLPEDMPFLGEIELVALGVNSSSRLMKDAGIEALPEKAQNLLIRLGVWDITRNPFPERAGIPCGNPEIFLPAGQDEERVDFTHMEAYAIDDESSNDPDDAVSWHEDRLYVHVADPAASILWNSPAEQEARERGENLYMPEKVIHMLPEEATERFGLGLNPVSSAMTFVIAFNDSGEPVLESVCLSRISVSRLTYETAGPVLEKFAELRQHLENFRLFREERGALFIRLPEVKIIAGDEIRFKPAPVTPEREFVAHAMLAAGHALAKWAVGKDIPLPFVTQEAPDDVPEAHPEGDSMPEMYALRRCCKPGMTGSSPGLHAGLGLEPYVRVTSPLRRYTDLLAHIQLHRFLAGEELLSSDEIESALAVSEDAAYTRRKLERTANEYWTLIHFMRHAKDLTLDACLVYRQDDRAFFLLPDYAYEYRCRFRGGKPGSRYQAQILSCDPVTFSLRLKMVNVTDSEEETYEAEGENEHE